MIAIGFKLLILALVIGAIVYFLCWRFFSKIGSGINKEVGKIKEENKKQGRDV